MLHTCPHGLGLGDDGIGYLLFQGEGAQEEGGAAEGGAGGREREAEGERARENIAGEEDNVANPLVIYCTAWPRSLVIYCAACSGLVPWLSNGCTPICLTS